MHELEIYFVDVKRTPRGTARVKERIAAGKCVACECSTEQANPAGRSKHTCERCRSRIRTMAAKLPPRKRAAFLGELVRSGHALVSQEIRQLKKPDFLQKLFEHVAN